MTTTPPRDGLTRENTGYPHDVYRGWYLTPEGLANAERLAMMRRAGAAVPDAFPERPVRAVPSGATTRHGMRSCRECKTTFAPTTPHNVYCNVKCQKKAEYRRRSSQSAKPKPQPRKSITVQCVICDREFEAINRGKATRQTCSKPCRDELSWRSWQKRGAA